MRRGVAMSFLTRCIHGKIFLLVNCTPGHDEVAIMKDRKERAIQLLIYLFSLYNQTVGEVAS